MKAISNRILAGSRALFEIRGARADLGCEGRYGLVSGRRDQLDDVWLRSPTGSQQRRPWARLLRRP